MALRKADAAVAESDARRSALAASECAAGSGSLATDSAGVGQL